MTRQLAHDIDDQVVSWLVRGAGLSEELARDVVAEIRWTERRAEWKALENLLDVFGNYGVSVDGVCVLNDGQHAALREAYELLGSIKEEQAA